MKRLVALAGMTAALLATGARAATPECEPQTKFDVARIDAQFILLNEVHGNVETPAFTRGLVCSLLRAGRSVVLAVERSGDEQAGLNAYLDSDGDAPARVALLAANLWHGKCQDGRTSEAMLDLIESMRRLRRAGQRVGILAFEVSNGLRVPMTVEEGARLGPADNRLVSRIIDRNMADNLLYNGILYRGYTFVVLTGHAYTDKGYPADPDFIPMGALLGAAAPAFYIGFETPGGTSWRAGSKGCRPIDLQAGRLFTDSTKIDAIVVLDSLTSSAPAVPAL